MPTRLHAILLAFVIGNLALVLAFPPYDYLSLAHQNLPTFDGFYPCFDVPANRRLNADFLTLEVLAVLINGCLGWLFINRSGKQQATSWLSRGLLCFVAINLALIMLFPPFADYRMINRSFIPSFEGFYFLFADNTSRRLVDEILFLEIAMLLVNASLAWMILRENDFQAHLLKRPHDRTS